MNRVLEELAPGSRIAVIRIRSLGDSVLSTPAIHLLKQARSDVEIAIICEPRFNAVFEGNPDIHCILPPSLRRLRTFAPDLVINLHGGTSSARLTLLSGAKWRAGYSHFRYSRVYNLAIPRAQDILSEERTVHTAEHVASAMFYLGVRQSEIPRARLFPTERAPRLPVPGPYAVFHPVAAAPEKTWPAPFFLSAAQHVKRELGLQPVFIGAAGEDLSVFQVWPSLSGAPLSTVKTLLSEAVLFVGNDSGPAHMAAAFGIPVAVVFGPSDPEIWYPWRTEAQVLRADGPIHAVTEAQMIRALDRMRVRV